MLWGRAANRCAFPDCKQQLVVESTDTDDETVVGEECHIVAQSKNGPRGESLLAEDQRDKYANLVLMCAVHHKVIDDQPIEYTVDRLREIKRLHETWVRQSLGSFDTAKQKDDEQYAEMIEQLADRAHFNNWQNWSSFVLSADPSINKSVYESLEDTCTWLMSRIWPRRYECLESSLHNFQNVLHEFVNHFSKHLLPDGETLFVDKFYKINEWNPERYHRLAAEHEFYVDLLGDLMLELTRAANYVCDSVRESVFPAFRLSEGALLVMDGPYFDMKYRIRRCEYREDERTPKPFSGLQDFLSIRSSRDLSFGEGTAPNYGPAAQHE